MSIKNYHFKREKVKEGTETIATKLSATYNSRSLAFGLSNGFFKMNDGRVGIGAYENINNFLEYKREEDGWVAIENPNHNSYKNKYLNNEVEAIILDKLAQITFFQKIAKSFSKN